MGMAIFTESGTFNPSSYGLKTGQTLQIVCVGGGNGGNGGASSVSGNGGDAGAGGLGALSLPSYTYGAGGDSGRGYGAGGGGGCCGNQQGGYYTSGDGGNAGEIVFGTHTLATLQSITVTVGFGGAGGIGGVPSDDNNYNKGSVGGDSKFGTTIIAKGGGGAPGGRGSINANGGGGGGGGGGGYIIGSHLFGGSGGHGTAQGEEDATSIINYWARQGHINGGAGGAYTSIVSRLDGRSDGIGSGVVVVTW